MPENDKIIKSLIYVDEPQLGGIVLDFPNYVKTISDIILNSTPQFTVGIFGEWGTGKSTLMKNIKSVLENSNCNCLEFNAWRYEGEPRSATYPLMLSIIGRIIQDVEVQRYIQSRPILYKESLGKKIIRVLKGLSGTVSFGIPGIANVELGVDPDKMTSNSKPTTDIYMFYDENKPVLQEGVELIQEMLPYLAHPHSNPQLKLTVLIDDLDRCTPEKAAEVFESIKIFFDIRGIVFVLGLSRAVIEAAIDLKYKHFSHEIFSGSDYLKKIIQVPFTIPTWTEDDIKEYLKVLLDTHVNPYTEFLKSRENILLISRLVEPNPREVKRLLNNFILTRQIYGENELIKDKTLLIIQAIGLGWRWFHDAVFTDPSYLDLIYKTLDSMSELFFDDTDGQRKWISKKEEKYPIGLRSILLKMATNGKLNRILIENRSTLLEMRGKAWSEYRRASNIIEPEFGRFESRDISLDDSIRYRLRQEIGMIEYEIKKKEHDYEIAKPRFRLLANNEQISKLRSIAREISDLERRRNELIHTLEEPSRDR